MLGTGTRRARPALSRALHLAPTLSRALRASTSSPASAWSGRRGRGAVPNALLRAYISTSPPAGGAARTRRAEQGGSASALSVLSTVSFSEQTAGVRGAGGAAAAATAAAAASGASLEPNASSFKHWAKIYAELSKARLSALVVATTTTGFLMAGTPVDWTACAAVSAGTTLAACSAATWNQIFETRTDGLMKRTRNRPLPSGRISPRHAAAFGAATAASSGAVLLAGTNPITAALGLGNIALYALVYTPMKQRSIYNTWVGAVVGAIPPVMGWTAATGGALCTPDAAA